MEKLLYIKLQDCAYGHIDFDDDRRVTIYKGSQLSPKGGTKDNKRTREVAQLRAKLKNEGFIDENETKFLKDYDGFASTNDAGWFIKYLDGYAYAQWEYSEDKQKWIKAKEMPQDKWNISYRKGTGQKGLEQGTQVEVLSDNDENNENEESSENNENSKCYPLNQILYGPPGTGKTYHTVIYAVAICDNKEIEEVKKASYDKIVKRFNQLKEEGRIEFITFHQSYGYEEFIQGIKPAVNAKGEVVYKVENGIFKGFCDKVKEPDEKCVFIIDEINRGNVSKIFGELITLIEESKRISAVAPNKGMRAKLPYKDENGKDVMFGVPDNVYILGTMNTADRSLVQLDAALRRRFRFIEMMPNYELLEDKAEDGIDVKRLLKAINEKVRETIDREHQIGHSYLIGVKTKKALQEKFEYEIIPLLQEYFYEDYENIKEVLGRQAFTDDEQKIDLTKFSFKRIYGENEKEPQVEDEQQ